MKLKEHQRVRVEDAKAAALSALNPSSPLPASWVANAIWPDHQMKPQGAGAAASRILKLLEKDGAVKWVSRTHRWGWIRTGVFPRSPPDV